MADKKSVTFQASPGLKKQPSLTEKSEKTAETEAEQFKKSVTEYDIYYFETKTRELVQ